MVFLHAIPLLDDGVSMLINSKKVQKYFVFITEGVFFQVQTLQPCTEHDFHEPAKIRSH